ncbi:MULTISPECIES: DUF3085 domain-containing protein [unclassified Pseudoalteromonas]|jgi:hypothetical protein|uniref:DUF3085 domain-containing protein n=1 Tax=unclassified Pseudoalteromonas TaxID=194690 RepID=UPI0023580E3F|nr:MULTISPECIES: DUF3085 domain-containing protein [unclassified Pseudoalteromonas]MDC9502852.1 DUF3085 domain-containing protein [Pseudoalteromonas sp. Angola-18]MDC9530294.1 DUF3085 domain-containing protein [Pseudoalteromonas sp. Angola-7]
MKNFNVGLNREQAHRLREFCDLHSKENFLFVKDKELYFLAATGSIANNNFQTCVEHIQGYDPKIDLDYYEKARAILGAHDFSEKFEVSILKQFLASKYNRVNFRFKVSSITVTFSG